MKILIIRKIFKHHSKYSGYDVLFNSDIFKNALCININRIDKYVKGWGWLITYLKKKYIIKQKYYNNINFVAEIFSIIITKLKKIDIIHVSYIEPNVFLLNKYRHKFKKCRIVGTIHLPTFFWEIGFYSIKDIDSFDGIVVLDKISENYFKKKLAKTSVKFIPHGVNTNIFKPNLKLKNTNSHLTCLICGNFLRDFNLVKECVFMAKEKNINVRFEMVLTHESIDNNLYEFIKLKNTTIVNINVNISDQELIKLYQYVDIVFLPLLDSTANNVLLEGISSGLPIITTKGGCESYLNDKYSFIYNNNEYEKIVDKFDFLSKNKNILIEMGNEARMAAINNFDWKIIEIEIFKFYKSLQLY